MGSAAWGTGAENGGMSVGVFVVEYAVLVWGIPE